MKYILLSAFLITFLVSVIETKFLYNDVNLYKEKFYLKEMSENYTDIENLKYFQFPINYRHPNQDQLFIVLDADPKRIWMSDYNNWINHKEKIRCTKRYPFSHYECNGWNNFMLEIANDYTKLICSERRFTSCHLKIQLEITCFGGLVWFFVAALSICGVPAILLMLCRLIAYVFSKVINIVRFYSEQYNKHKQLEDDGVDIDVSSEI